MAEGKEAGARRERGSGWGGARAHLRRAGRGSGPRAALGAGASAPARVPGSRPGARAPRPSPAQQALSEVLESRLPGLGPPRPKSYTDSSVPFPFREAPVSMRTVHLRMDLSPGYQVTNGGNLVPGP